MTDNFNGDTPHLIRCIEALLRLDADGALVPHRIPGHARTMLEAAAVRLTAAGGKVPEGYELVMVPKLQPADEPDWDECIRQAEVATGLKVERHTLSIVIREVRRWLAGRAAGVGGPDHQTFSRGAKD